MSEIVGLQLHRPDPLVRQGFRLLTYPLQALAPLPRLTKLDVMGLGIKEIEPGATYSIMWETHRIDWIPREGDTIEHAVAQFNAGLARVGAPYMLAVQP